MQGSMLCPVQLYENQNEPRLGVTPFSGAEARVRMPGWLLTQPAWLLTQHSTASHESNAQASCPRNPSKDHHDPQLIMQRQHQIQMMTLCKHSCHRQSHSRYLVSISSSATVPATVWQANWLESASAELPRQHTAALPSAVLGCVSA